MHSSLSEKQLRAFAEWLNQPLLPGSEQELNRWLAEDSSNQDTWEAWQLINGRAKRLQVIPADVNAEWATLRDELGFVHSGKRKKPKRSSGSKREFRKQPGVIAILSMIVYALFLYALHLLRVEVGF